MPEKKSLKEKQKLSELSQWLNTSVMRFIWAAKKCNKIHLCVKKTKYITFQTRNKQDHPITALKFEGNVLEEDKTKTLLGVWFIEDLFRHNSCH